MEDPANATLLSFTSDPTTGRLPDLSSSKTSSPLLPETSAPEPKPEQANSPLLPPTPPTPPTFVFQKTDAGGSATRKTKKPLLIGGAILILILGLVGGTVQLFKSQKLSLVQKAAQWEGKLVCMPVDDSENLTNEKYKYSRIKVINNTAVAIPVWIQENECPIQENLSPGYVCNDYKSRRNDTVGAGESKVYSMEVSCQKIGQLDIKRDNDLSPQCFNTIDNREWDGGIAFTIKANTSPCCPQINLTVSPSTAKSGETITFTASSSKPLVCINLSTTGGISGDLRNFRMEGQYVWKWDATAGSTGTYTATITGNTQDSGQGDCPQRAMGTWCETKANFTIGTALLPTLTSTPTPTKQPTPTPTSEPTSTPTPLPACVNVQISVNGGDLNDLKIGDSLTFNVTFSGTVEDVGVVIKKDGVRVQTLTAGGAKTNSWTSPAYTIESIGSYEVSAYVKVNGVWQ